MKKFILPILLFLPGLASAHENYVLPKADIDRGMMDWSLNVFSALKNPHNLVIALGAGLGITIAFTIFYFLSFSKAGIFLGRKIQKLEPLGHVILRVALAVSFFASAYFNSFLGPEIPLSSIPAGSIIRLVLAISGFLILFGFLTELAGLIGLIILILTTFVYKDYMLTYFNYFGEFAALMLFGSRFFSWDKIRTKASAWQNKFKAWEIPLIRITYGISVLYPAISIKLLHPIIMVEIANKYNLMQFHWLFPPDPLLISLGTGLAQIAVGLFIIFGFETRLASLATLFLYLGSILFFKEAVWPHYILLALALYLVINDGGEYSIDKFIERRKMKT